MPIFHAMLSLESYRLSIDRPGAFGDEILLDGWFLTHEAVTDIHLLFPNGQEIEVADRAIPSEGVFGFHGGTFGERARACRFRLVELIGARDLDLRAAVLRVRVAGGDEMRSAIGGHLQLPDRPAFTPDERALIMRFESCGDSCEFGLVQRLVGNERLGLLRYAGVGDVGVLCDAIEKGLVELEWPGAVLVEPQGHEWVAYVFGTRVAIHTGRSVESITREKIVAAETTKLVFLAQKFLGDCEDAGKIFVYRVQRDERGGPDGTRGMDRLYDALAARGPVRLLWVNEADGAHPHRTVEHLRDGLYRGWIEHLAPHSNAFDFRPRAWLELLAVAEAAIAGRAIGSAPVS